MRAVERVSGILLLSAGVLVYGYCAVHTVAGRPFSVKVDLSRPESIVWPFEIAVVGDLGEEGLRIGPKVGAGWTGKTGGAATYRFYVPEDAEYWLWAYALWFDKCTNAVFAKVDTQDKAIVGNDPVFQKWHWVRGFSVRLTKGPHTLQLSNHSDNIALQSMLFANGVTVLPGDQSTVFSDVFYDGFDGCHIGRFISWDKATGRWGVERPAASSGHVENALVARSTDSALIFHRGDDWRDYALRVAVKSMPAPDSRVAVGVLFGVQAADRFYQVQWRSLDESGRSQVRLCRQAGTDVETLAAAEAVCSPGVWHDVEIVLEGRTIKVNFDRTDLLEQSVDRDIAGGIGFLLEGECTAYFDSVHVRTTAGTVDSGTTRL
jgi:hypothetical protein